MGTQVYDSSNPESILAAAGVEIEEKKDDNSEAGTGKSGTEADAKGSEGSEKAVAQAHQDDEEDENGLTPEEREGLTNRMQKAVGKKHRMMKEAEEFAAAQYSERKLAEQRAENLERQLQELKSKLAPAQEEKASEKPQRQSFKTEEEYLDAMIKHGVEEGIRQREAEAARIQAEKEAQQVIEAAKARVAKAAELVPDWSEVVGSVDTVVPPAVAAYMQESELFAELGYHFGKNPEVLESLAKLPQNKQLLTIAKIEATLQPFGAKSAPSADKASSEFNGQPKAEPSNDNAKPASKPREEAPVIKPLDGGGSGLQKDFRNMNIREAIQDFQKNNQVNLTRRKRH